LNIKKRKSEKRNPFHDTVQYERVYISNNIFL
jgi:hypothetical protein